MLELIDVRKTYITKSGETNALNGLSVTLPDSGLVFVIGKSGCGKTTLLNCVGGLDGIDDGEIIIDGKRFSEFSVEDYDSYRNTFIGFIFQEYNLLPEYTIEKNIMIANELQGVESDPQAINEILKLVDLEGLNQRKPSELSGGQKQRVAIARALIKNPKIIMADEPTGALDSNTGVQVMETLKKLSKDKLIIIVSHDLELAERFADRIIRLVDGKLVEDVTLTDTEITSNVLFKNEKLTVKAGADLTEAETATLVKAIRDRKEIQVTDRIDQREKRPTESITAVHPEKPVTFTNSKMKYKSAAGLGLRSLAVKPLRLIATIFLSVIAFALFGIFDTIGAYNDATAISNLLRSKEYSSIVVNASHVDNGTGANVRLSKTSIDRINKDTKHNFRGLYEVYDKAYSGINNSVQIMEINTTLKTGSEYYYYHVDDFIEFSPSEITKVTKDGKEYQVIDQDGFNFPIVAGRYPTLPSERLYDTGDPMQPMSYYNFTEIAISKYLAESLLYWLPKSNPSGLAYLNGNLMTKVEDFVGQNITVDNGYTIDGGRIPYVITGIIDTGVIPNKYASLKDAFPNEHTNALANDLATHINTGAYLKFFVPTGYVSEWTAFNGRKATYFTGDNTYTIIRKTVEGGNLSVTHNGGITPFYNYTADFKASGKENGNVFFFGDSDLDKTLGQNEVLLSTDMFQKIYKNEIASMPDSDSVRVFQVLDDNKQYTPFYKQMYFNEFEKSLGSNVFKNITLEKKNISNPKDVQTFTFKVVGIYGGVNTDIAGRGVYTYGPMMFSKAGLEKLGVHADQGLYARMISTVNSSYFSATALSKEMSSETGFKLNWYKNSVLNNIKDNRVFLKQFSSLFLYVSILLAFFSVFMLFNYISTSIVSKRQSIGVLRALGSNGKDIFKIFFTESMVISITNGIFASLVAFIGCIFVNGYIKNIMNLTLNFAIFGIRQIIVLMVISIITGTLSSLLPIIRICKEKPVELIRKF